MEKIIWQDYMSISQDDFNNRKSICTTCENFVEKSIKCNVCGCPAANFWVSPSSECPAGKFNQIISTEENDHTFTEGTSTSFERENKPA